jgi:diguanylate cyclase (GGDEF)-like protein
MGMKGMRMIKSKAKKPRAAASTSADHARELFEYAPISLWEEDYSQVKLYLDDLRAQGVEDLRIYLADHPQSILDCIARIKVLMVNRATLQLFGAVNQTELLDNLDKIFRDEMGVHFEEELIDMWEGRYSYEREGVNYALNGTPIDINLHWAVLPGYENTLGRVLVSISDITARKKAERYLTYLGTHDVLTGVFNRGYFEDELNRLGKSRRFPVSILIADLDGLKDANDRHGHAAGDELLRRTAEVFKASVRAEDVVARIGGDEFAVILAETDEISGASAIERIQRLLALNNTFYQGSRLSISMGLATGEQGDNLEDVQRLADDRMYQMKRRHKPAGGRAPRDTRA